MRPSFKPIWVFCQEKKQRRLDRTCHAPRHLIILLRFAWWHNVWHNRLGVGFAIKEVAGSTLCWGTSEQVVHVLEFLIPSSLIWYQSMRSEYSSGWEVWQIGHMLVAWHSGTTSVFGLQTYLVLHSTCSWRMTTNVGKPSAIGQPTRPTQPFIPSTLIDE